MDRPGPRIPVVRAPREILGEGIPDLDAVASAGAGDVRGVVLDLAGVEFISSAGLGHLVRVGLGLKERGAVLALAAAGRNVARLLRTVGFDRVMPLFRTVDEASASFRVAR